MGDGAHAEGIGSHYGDAANSRCTRVPCGHEPTETPTALRPPGTCRYNVLGAHPSCRATSTADILPEASMAFAALILDSSSAAGRPPRRPRAAADISPARVRSTM